MKKLSVLLLLLLTGCDAAIQQRMVIQSCLDKCKDGNVECINACANMLRGCDAKK